MNWVLPTSADAFRNWLRNSIGSNFYYDSNDTAGSSAAHMIKYLRKSETNLKKR